MQFVLRFFTRVSGLCCSQSSENERREFMGRDGSQTEIGGNSDSDTEAGESVRMAEGLQTESESGDTSRSKYNAMHDRVIMALIIARVIEFVGSQSFDNNATIEMMGKVSESRRLNDEESGSRTGSVTKPQSTPEQEQEPQSRSGKELQIRPLEEPQIVRETGESSGSRGQVSDSVRLVTSWFSPFAHSVAISLREKRINYVVIEESVLNKNERTLNANPLSKRIPILMHRGRVISESRIIMEYIDEAWPESPSALLPKDPFERSAARYWGDYIDKKISQILLQHIGVNAKEVYKTVNDALIGLNKAMTVISHGKSFFMGDRLGFVDIVFAPLIPWFQVLQRLDKYKIPDAHKCPRLHEWLFALQNHPSVRPSLEASSAKKLRPFIVQRFRQARK